MANEVKLRFGSVQELRYFKSNIARLYELIKQLGGEKLTKALNLKVCTWRYAKLGDGLIDDDNLLYWAFDWSASLQGSEYWESIDRELEYMIYNDIEILNRNKNRLIELLFRLGGQELVLELNEKDCDWCDWFGDVLIDDEDLLNFAFEWSESTQGHHFWEDICYKLTDARKHEKVFKVNRRKLYKLLYVFGGRDLVLNLNNKECKWEDKFMNDSLDGSELLGNAFSWIESKQGHSFWQDIFFKITNVEEDYDGNL